MIKKISISSAFILLVLFQLQFEGIPRLGKFFNFSSGFLSIRTPDKNLHDIRINHSQYRGTVAVDSVGIPHIFADDMNHASFFIGYMHARDRYFQMELMIRLMSGTISEIVGEKGVESDNYWRSFHFESTLEKQYQTEKQKNSELYQRLSAYAEGIKYYFKNRTHSELPEEYHLLDIEPMPWETHYSLLVGKYMANTLNHNKIDLHFQKLQNYLSPELIQRFYPLQEELLETIIPEKNRQHYDEKFLEKLNKSIDAILNIIYNAEEEKNRSIIGSNNWAVSAKKTKSGAAILNNDMHLQLSLPGPWYEIHVHTNQNHLYGLSIPAVPLIIHGFNGHTAWGMTNAHWDLIDYFIVHEKDKNHLYYGNLELPIQEVTDTIHVRHGESRIVQNRFCDKGPIIQMDSLHFLVEWTGYLESTESQAFMRMESAKNWQDFTQAFSHLNTPPQNFVFADDQGNIGIYTAGKMPIKNKNYERGVFLSSDTNAVNQGYIPFEQLPHIYNPDKQFVASANQRQIYNYDYYLNWSTISSPYRGKRISDRLANMNQVTMDSMRLIHGDLYDFGAHEFLEAILQNSNDSVDGQMFTDLKTWDKLFTMNSVSATIFSEFYSIFSDSVNAFLHGNQNLMHIPDFVLIRDLKNNRGIQINNRQLVYKDLLKYAFSKALTNLTAEFGTDRSQWQYGNYHKTTFKHLLRLDAFSYPEFSSVGSQFTVNVARGRQTTHGPSERTVIQLSKPVLAWFSISGGQSGRPSSPLFSNQIDLFKQVQYRKVQYNENQDELLKIAYWINRHD